MYSIKASWKGEVVLSGAVKTLQEARDIAQLLFEAHYKVQVEDYTMVEDNGFIHFQEMYCEYAKHSYCYAEKCDENCCYADSINLLTEADI